MRKSYRNALQIKNWGTLHSGMPRHFKVNDIENKNRETALD